MSTAAHLNGTNRSAWASTGEPQVVSARKLAAILQRFIDQWHTDRPSASHGYTGFAGPIGYLSRESGVNTRQISRILHHEQTWVGLGKADALLQAIDTGERIGTDIQVRRNPNWSLEKWHAYMETRGCV